MRTDSGPDLILFCGAFDPPHAGHVDLLRTALARFPAATALVVPSPTPAGALGRHKTPNASASDRHDLCVAAFDRVAGLEGRVEVSDLESTLPAPHYTVRTLEALRALRPTVRLGLLIGADQLKSFPDWREPRRILELADLVAAPRPALAPGLDTRSAARDMAATLGLRATPGGPGELHLDGGCGRVYTLVEPPRPAASTAIRTALARGDDPEPGWLPAPVAALIRARGLYRLDPPTTAQER